MNNGRKGGIITLTINYMLSRSFLAADLLWEIGEKNAKELEKEIEAKGARRMEERLQKIIAAAGVTSRRKAEELITAGRVKVNGKIVTDLGSKADALQDRIAIDNVEIAQVNQLHYILLYKPAGYITSVSDPRGRRTVMDLVPQEARLYPVGRLDYATSGLLILTNDGKLTNGLLHPKYEVPKCYHGAVRGKVTAAQVDKVRRGIKLADGWTAPAQCHVVQETPTQTVLEITIHEGRNRQVRRMLAALGLEVVWLSRRSFAGLSLGNLRPGQYRTLEKDEVRELQRWAGLIPGEDPKVAAAKKRKPEGVNRWQN